MSPILPSGPIAPFLLTQRGSNDAALDWTWKETPNSHIFRFHLPGYSKSDININIHTDTRVLHITSKIDKNNADANADEEDENKNVTWHCRERMVSGGKLSKQFRLPKDARIDGISASMKDGVLVVNVEKECGLDGEGRKINEEERKSKSVEIEGGKDDRRGGKKGGGGVLGNCFVCFKS